MRKTFLTTAAIVALGTSAAMAADLGAMPTKAYAPAAAPWSWTGAYVGLNAGYAWGNSDATPVNVGQLGMINGVAIAPPSVSARPQGFIGGGQIGYNWQTGPWVLGAELDFSGINARTNTSVEPFFSGKGGPTSATYSSRYDWLATARLRGGVTVAPNWLVYVTGGLAVTHAKDSIYSAQPGIFFGDTVVTWSNSSTLYGGVIGAGTEYAFAPNWSMKVEYLYAKFDDTTPTVTSSFHLTVPVGPIASFHHDLSTVRAGINYKFGG